MEYRFYKKVYFVQTSQPWEFAMTFLSIMHMYIIIFENTTLDTFYHVASPIIYFFYLLDFFMQTYHESYDFVSKKARFATIFKLKILILVLLGIDEIFLGIHLNVAGRPIHPFRILRVGIYVFM